MMILFPRMTCKKPGYSKIDCFSGASTYNHSDVVLLSVLAKLGSLIDDHVHEGIEAAEDSLHAAASIQLQRQFLVHVPSEINKTRESETFPGAIGFHSLFQLWGMCLRHDALVVLPEML